MYAKFFAVAALVSAVIALPQATPNQCSVGKLQCCDQVQDASHDDVHDAVTKGVADGLLSGIQADDILNGVGIPIGLSCTPITIIGVGQAKCTNQQVCCTGNTFGTVSVGCNNVNVL